MLSFLQVMDKGSLKSKMTNMLQIYGALATFEYKLKLFAHAWTPKKLEPRK